MGFENGKVNMDEVVWINEDIDKNRFVEEIVTDCISKKHFSKQIYGEETAIRSSVTCEIVDKLSNAEADVRVVQIAVDECGSFSEMIERILARCFDDDKFSSDDTVVERKDFEGISDEGMLCHQIRCLLRGFSNANIFLLIILENFEKSKLYWSPTHYWEMRSLIFDYQNLSVVMSSDCKVSEIIEATPFVMSKELDNSLSASQSNITDFSTIETVLNSLLALPLEKALTPSLQDEDGIFKDISFFCNISVEKVKKQSYFELICQLMNPDIFPEVRFLSEEIICDLWACPHHLSFDILSCLLRSALTTNSVVTQFFNINLQAYVQYISSTVGKYDYDKAPRMVGAFMRSFKKSFIRDIPSINEVTLDSTTRKLFGGYIQAWKPRGETLESYGERMLNIGQTLFYIALQFPYEYVTNYSKD